MSKQAQYSVTFGLAGCYMPDSGPHLVECSTRKDLADFIRHEIEFYEMPASLFREVGIRRLWQFIQRNGSSVAHFSLEHKGQSLAFHGLTNEEADNMRAAEEY